MENYYSSYPDSGDSSPRSREIECENPAAAAAWDEPPPPPPSSANNSNYHHRVKFMCSYGGKIQPRTHDNQLSYVGGDTKILAVDRGIRYPTLLTRLSSLLTLSTNTTNTPSSSSSDASAAVCFKYQLPGEDLDALISVTNDEDLDHMILEYDRLQRSSPKPARLRLFLSPLSPPPAAATTTTTTTNGGGGFPSSESKSSSDRQWFVDALNSTPAQSAPFLDSNSPPEAFSATINPNLLFTNPDFLFGLEKGFVPLAVKVPDPAPESTASPVDDVGITVEETGSDSKKEDKWIGGGDELVLDQGEIQRQIQELQRLQITSQEQTAAFQQQRKDINEESLSRAYPGDYYLPPKVLVQQKAPSLAQAPPQIPSTYWQERQVTSGVYASMPGLEQPVYLIPAPQGVYSGAIMQSMTSQAGQGYYAAQRMVPEVVPPPSAVYGVGAPQQPPSKGVGNYADGGSAIRPQGVVEPGGGFTGAQLLAGYDSTGRAVYYTRTTAGGGILPTYQTVTSPDAVRSATAQSSPPSAAAAAAVTTGPLLDQECK